MDSLMGLTQARKQYERKFLTQKCDIQRNLPGTPGAYGGQKHTLQTMHAGVPCKPQRARRPQTVETPGQNVSVTDWEVLLPAEGYAVAFGDIIKIGPDTYEVKGSDAGAEGVLLLTAYCTRI